MWHKVTIPKYPKSKFTDSVSVIQVVLYEWTREGLWTQLRCKHSQWHISGSAFGFPFFCESNDVIDLADCVHLLKAINAQLVPCHLLMIRGLDRKHLCVYFSDPTAKKKEKTKWRSARWVYRALHCVDYQNWSISLCKCVILCKGTCMLQTKCLLDCQTVQNNIFSSPLEMWQRVRVRSEEAFQMGASVAAQHAPLDLLMFRICWDLPSFVRSQHSATTHIHGHTTMALTILVSLPPQGYILYCVMLDCFPPPHVLNLASHLPVLCESTKITAREIPASASGCCRVRPFCRSIWRRRRQRTHGKPYPGKWSIVHLCVSVLPPLSSCFYTYIVLHPYSFLSRCSLPPPPPPPSPSSSLPIKDEKHINTVDVSFICGTILTAEWVRTIVGL